MKFIAKQNHLLKEFLCEAQERLETMRSSEHHNLYRNEIKHLLCYIDYLEADIAGNGWHENEVEF